jgi:hypothetical protein
MMHPDTVALRQFTDGELQGNVAEDVRLHTQHCPACAAAIEALPGEDAWIVSLFSTLDSPAPSFKLNDRSGRASPQWLRRAAAVLLLSTLAGAAWALPGSPVRSWLNPQPEPVAHVPVNGPDATPAIERGGLDITAGGAVHIRFAEAQTRGLLHIFFSDSTAVRLTVFNDDVRFDAQSDGNVFVDNTGSFADYEIRIPRDAADLTIRLADTIIFRIRDGRIEASSQPSPDGSVTLRLDRT